MGQGNLENNTKLKGQNEESWRITYAIFGADKEKENLRINGNEFDNNALLEVLGFRENSKGEMTAKTEPHLSIRDGKGKVKRDSKGRAIRRTVDGRPLTGNKEEIER